MRWMFVALLAGLFAAAPFLSSRGLGSSEAYNYSLATADAVTQFRAGQFPVLVGQSEFAFNGRIHPLRTAPLLAYAAGALDLLTLHRLGFWTLQNLLLASCLVGGALACYHGLRRATAASPATSALLAGVYVLSPPVLAAAYGMDLYMTVLTVPLVPLVVAANVSSLNGRRGDAFVLLAVWLAASWLAHPPTALWLTLVTLGLQVLALGRGRPEAREWRTLAGASVLFLVLAGFAFASALTIATAHDILQHNDVSGLLAEVHRSFAASLRPVSPRADHLGDFQLGYAGWALALGGIALATRQRHAPALSLLAAAALLCALTTPVPGLTRWLWSHAPGTVFNLTSQWPMQRLYLPMTALVLFAFALVWRPPAAPAALVRDGLRVLLVLAAGWVVWQGERFVARGFATRNNQAAAPHSHAPGGVDLTVISYALLGAPGSFVNGVMDPAFELRLLAPYDLHELATNWSAPLKESPANRAGLLRAVASDSPTTLDLEPTLVLEPGARYRLTFSFLAPAADATLQIRGPALLREYRLPAAGNARGFGMEPGHNPALTIWTNQAVPESVQLRAIGGAAALEAWRDRPFARYRLERFAPDDLPLQLESLVPLRVRVHATEPGYLETPRLFIDGYAATVNGAPVRLQASPEGLLMLPVPAGTSEVVVRYPGPRVVRWTFWLGLLGWAGVAALGLGRALPAGMRRPLAAAATHAGQRAGAAWPRLPPRGWALGAATVLLLAAAGWGWRQWDQARHSVGPVRLRFVLPRGQTNRQQPLLVTGRPNAGTFVYVVYAGPDRIRLGVDVWGRFHFETESLRVDYFSAHELVVDSGALYPPGDPSARPHLRLVFDGQPVFDRALDTYPSARADVTVGLNRIGGSTCEPAFSGRILGIERLPRPGPGR